MSQRERERRDPSFLCVRYFGWGWGRGCRFLQCMLVVHASFSFSKVGPKKKGTFRSLVNTSTHAGSRCEAKFVKQLQKPGGCGRNMEDEGDRPIYIYLQTGGEEHSCPGPGRDS